MLDRSHPPRKDSLSNLAHLRRTGRLPTEQLELPVGQAIQERLGGRWGQRRVSQEGVPDAALEAPAGVPGDSRQGGGLRARLRRGLHDVRLGYEPVIQHRFEDAGVRVEPQGDEASPPRQAGDGHALGDRHLREPAEELGVGRATHLRVDAGVGGQVRQVAPVERFDQGQRVGSRGVAVACDRQPNGVQPAGLRIPEHLRDLVGREIRPPELPEKLSLGAHP